MRGRRQSRGALIGLIWALVLQSPTLSGQESSTTQIDFQQCPAGTEVYLDGSWIGTTNASNHFQIRGLLPGTYQFSFKKDGQRIHSCSIPLVPGQSVSVSIAPTPPPSPEKIPAPPHRENPAPKVTAVAPVTQQPAAPVPTPSIVLENPLIHTSVTHQPAPPVPPQPFFPASTAPAKANLPPKPRPAGPQSASIDERIVLFPLLAVMLVLGSLLASRFFARGPASLNEPASPAAAQSVKEEPEEFVVRSGEISHSEPEFLQELRFRESLFQKGFSKPKRVSERDIVVDIDSYEVGKEL